MGCFLRVLGYTLDMLVGMAKRVLRTDKTKLRGSDQAYESILKLRPVKEGSSTGWELGIYPVSEKGPITFLKGPNPGTFGFRRFVAEFFYGGLYTVLFLFLGNAF